jgi:hypothetical protein
MAFLKAIDVSELIGQQGTDAERGRVQSLMQLIMSAIEPDSWYPVGGDGSVRSFFNQPKQRWYLVVSNATDLTAPLQTVLGGLKPP